MANKAHQYGSSGEVQKLKDPAQRWVFRPGALNIVWGNDDRYWTFFPGDNYVELKQVCWLEVTGSTNEKLEKGKSYEVSFKIEMTEGAFGWNGCPVFVMAKIGKKGKYKWEKINFSDFLNKGKIEVPCAPINGKLIIEVPKDSGDDTVLHFGLYEVWTGRWKGGLKLHEAQVKEIP